MSCPQSGVVDGCAFAQFLVDETPKFDEMILEDIRPTDGWMYNVKSGFVPPGTPVEVTQDRFRSVFPNTTKPWTRVNAASPGCTGSPCDPTEHQVGWGADRLTWFAETQSWGTPLMCFDQQLHVTHAQEHVNQIISKILKPATIAISSNFLRKRHLYWAKVKAVANAHFAQAATDGVFTYQWTLDANGDERYFDCSASPTRVFKLVPQMLQNRFNDLMLRGYSGENPFKDTSPFIELVTDIDTIHSLEHLGDQQGVGGANSPNVLGNWRFENFDASQKYWRYGFSGQIGNFMARMDPMGLRFNFVTDLGAGAAPNRYRYEVVLPYVNQITTGAGGAAGIGSDVNPSFSIAHFGLTQIHHKMGMELLTQESKPLNPELPFGHRDFGGKWQFVMDNLGADQNGVAINNTRRNKGKFIADFEYRIRPLYYEFLEVYFNKREQFCIPEIDTCSPDPGYPAQEYTSSLPPCPLPAAYTGTYNGGVPTGNQDGPVPAEPNATTPDI